MDHGLRTVDCRLQTNRFFFFLTLFVNWEQQYATDCYVIENSGFFVFVKNIWKSGMCILLAAHNEYLV